MQRYILSSYEPNKNDKSLSNFDIFNNSRIGGDGTDGGLAVFLKEVLNETGVIGYTLAITIVAVDEDDEVGGLEGHLRALMVAGGSAHSALRIAIDR